MLGVGRLPGPQDAESGVAMVGPVCPPGRTPTTSSETTRVAGTSAITTTPSASSCWHAVT
jgi:hypothetical protein